MVRGRRYTDVGTEAQAEGPAGASEAQFPAGPAVALVPTGSWAQGLSTPSLSRLRSLACTNLLEGGRTPQDDSCALRYKLHGCTYEMLKPQQERTA